MDSSFYCYAFRIPKWNFGPKLDDMLIEFYQIRSCFGKMVFKTIIQRNIRLSEAPSYGEDIITYDASSKGAKSYFKVIRRYWNLVEPYLGPMPKYGFKEKLGRKEMSLSQIYKILGDAGPKREKNLDRHKVFRDT